MKIITIVLLLILTNCAKHTVSTTYPVYTKPYHAYGMTWSERYSWLTKRSLTD